MYCNASGCLRHQVPGQYFCEIHAAAEVAENESDALEILETAREEHGRLDNWRKAGEAGVVLGLVGLTVVIFAANARRRVREAQRQWERLVAS
jgi:hypothetical protein